MIDLGGDASAFRDHLRSIDAQTLAPELFEVLFVGALGDQDWQDVRAVCAYRPNLLAAPHQTVNDALTAGHGDVVMVVGAGHRLFARALEHVYHVLCGQHSGDAPEIDGLVGRLADEAALVPVELWRDGVRLSAEGVPAGQPVAGLRWKSVVDASGSLSVPGSVLQVVSAYPLLRLSRSEVRAPTASEVLPVATMTWAGAALRLSLDLGSAALDGQQLLLRITNISTKLQFLALPEEMSAGRVSFEIPVLSAAAGDQLPRGLWSFMVQHADSKSSGAGLYRLVGPVGKPALLNGLGVAPCRLNGTIGLDIGLQRESLVTVDDPTAGSIQESATGSRLHLNLGDLHVHGMTSVAGKIGLGALQLPASIIADANGVHLEATMTGVKGTEPLTAAIGGGPHKRVGLSVDIDGLGQMKLLTTTKAQAPTATTSKQPTKTRTTSATKRKRRKSHRKGVVADLRRAVPKPLEPVVRRMRQRRTLRRIYRRLTRA